MNENRKILISLKRVRKTFMFSHFLNFCYLENAQNERYHYSNYLDMLRCKEIICLVAAVDVGGAGVGSVNTKLGFWLTFCSLGGSDCGGGGSGIW